MISKNRVKKKKKMNMRVKKYIFYCACSPNFFINALNDEKILYI